MMASFYIWISVFIIVILLITASAVSKVTVNVVALSAI